MSRVRLRRCVEAFDRMEARPDDAVTCPDRGEGTPATESIRVRGAADPDAGTCFVRCTRRGDRTEARVRFGRPASAPVA